MLCQTALKFIRPNIGMNIGKAINPQDFIPDDNSLKQNLLIGANFIMEKISGLLPESEIHKKKILRENSGELFFFIREKNSGTLIPDPD